MKALIFNKIIILSIFLSSHAKADFFETFSERTDREKKEQRDFRNKTHDKSSARIHKLDSYRVLRNSKKSDFTKKCKAIGKENFNAGYKCVSDGLDRFNLEYPDRGSDEYCKKQYGNLSKSEVKKKRNQLLSLGKSISYYPKKGSEDTELTVEHIESEVFCIERYILKIEPNDYAL